MPNMATSPEEALPEAVRDYLRKRGEPIEQEVSLQHREDSRDVRLTLIRAAWEQYEELPETVTMRYDPCEHAIVIELPEPTSERDEQVTLSDF